MENGLTTKIKTRLTERVQVCRKAFFDSFSHFKIRVFQVNTQSTQSQHWDSMPPVCPLTLSRPRMGLEGACSCPASQIGTCDLSDSAVSCRSLVEK